MNAFWVGILRLALRVVLLVVVLMLGTFHFGQREIKHTERAVPAPVDGVAVLYFLCAGSTWPRLFS